MSKRIVGILLFLAMANQTIAQNDFFFNHYMFNPSYFNPAWVGVEDKAFITGHHRSQWLGYESSFDGAGGAPSSQLVSLVIPMQAKLAGVGLAVSNDKVANLTNLQARLSVSMKKELRRGVIYGGVMPIMFSQSLDFSQFRAVEDGDPLILDGKETQANFDLSAGFYYESNQNYFVGFSAVNILEPSFDYGITAASGEALNNQVARSYLINAGITLGVSRDLLFKPTTLIRTDFNSYTFEITGIAYYQDKLWGGLSFRRSESISLLMGYGLLENRLKVGYSFDYVVKDREAKQATSHELFIRYDLPNLIFGGRKAVKTPRFNF